MSFFKKAVKAVKKVVEHTPSGMLLKHSLPATAMHYMKKQQNAVNDEMAALNAAMEEQRKKMDKPAELIDDQSKPAAVELGATDTGRLKGRQSLMVSRKASRINRTGLYIPG